jgi:hypothetical protein
MRSGSSLHRLAISDLLWRNRSQAVVVGGQSESQYRKKRGQMNSVKIVEDFWAAVWKAPQDVDAIDRFVLDDSSLPRAASTLFFEGQIQGLGDAVF